MSLPFRGACQAGEVELSARSRSTNKDHLQLPVETLRHLPSDLGVSGKLTSVRGQTNTINWVVWKSSKDINTN